MSSNRRTEALRERWRGVSLRTRLIAAILALMALVLTVIGVVTVVIMRERLVGQLDDRLVVGDELVGLDAAAQVVLDHQPVDGHGVHALVEEVPARAPGGLGP